MPEPPSHAAQTGRGMSGPGISRGLPPEGGAPRPGPARGRPEATAPPSAPAPAAGTPAGNGSRGRHGRTPARESAGDAALRRRLVRLAVLPAALVAVIGAALVAYVMSAGDAAGVGQDPAVWTVLVVALVVVCAAVGVGAYFASAEARRTVERYATLRGSVARGNGEVRALLRAIEAGQLPRRRPQPQLAPPSSHADAFDSLSHELAVAQHAAESAVADAAALVRSTSSGSEEKVEVFVNLARRLQSLVHREIELLDELENEVEDPDLLKGLFHVDHLATRIRRHAENLAVLGGAVSRRQWSRPVTLTEVLRSAIAEVEQYSRVKLVPPIDGTLRGHAVADVIHLLAELVENATVFSAPQTQVLLRAQHVTAGLAVEVEDRGLGMTGAEQERMNAVLSDPERIDVGELLQDGRIGLFVVSALAQRHGIVVQLQSNIYGGVQAVLVLPREVLGDNAAESAKSGQSGQGSQAGRNDREPQNAGQAPAAVGDGRQAPAVQAAPAQAALDGRREQSGQNGQTDQHGQSGQNGRQTPNGRPQPTGQAAAAGQAGHHGQAPQAGQAGQAAGRHGRQPAPAGATGAGNTAELPRIRAQERAEPARGESRGPVRALPPEATPPGGAPAQPLPQQHSAAQPGGQPGAQARSQPQAGGPASGPAPHQPHPGHGTQQQPLPPQRTDASAPASRPHPGAPAPGPASAGPPEADRPALPKRRRQEHLVPELRDDPHSAPPPARPDAQWDAAQDGHDPGLMAAFRRGTSLAEDSDGSQSGGYGSGSEGHDGIETTGGTPRADAPFPTPDEDSSRTSR